MKKLLVFVSCVILLWSCEDKPTLQKYFVKNTESPKFMALDLAPSIIKTDKSLVELKKINKKIIIEDGRQLLT